MNYTLNQLQIFLKVAQTQSVTRAAEELYLTQPAVSIQLKNFQDQFDIPLTEVVGRKIHITGFGKEIAAAAENILQQVYAINYRTLAHKGLMTGKLRIASVSTGKYVIPYFVAGFVQKHPGIELVIDVTNKSTVMEQFERNEYDFSLVSVLPENTRVGKIELIENRLFLVGNGESKQKRVNNPRDFFSQSQIIMRESGSGTRQIMEKFLMKNNFRLAGKMQLTSNEAVKQAVIAGLGYSIMPEIGIKNELQSGLIKIIPLRGLPIKSRWQLIWPQGKKHSPVAAAFLDYLKSEKEKIIKKHFDGIQ